MLFFFCSDIKDEIYFIAVMPEDFDEAIIE
jgi:hypothetical protein